MIFGLSKNIKEMYSLLLDSSNKVFISFWFFVFPLGIAISLVCFDFEIAPNQYTYLIGFMSIIIGFLINILATMISNKKIGSGLRIKLTRRIYSSATGFILFGVFLIILILISSWIQRIIFEKILYFFIYFLFIHLILILFSIIKGFYSLYK